MGISLTFSGETEAEIATVTAVSRDDIRCKVGDVVVRVDPRYYRPTEVESLLGDASKARKLLGWSPKISFESLVCEMVNADFESARRDKLIGEHGFQTFKFHE